MIKILEIPQQERIHWGEYIFIDGPAYEVSSQNFDLFRDMALSDLSGLDWDNIINIDCIT